MAFKVEDGSGVAGANAYCTPAFVTAYLTDRGRQTENTWSTGTESEQQAAIIAATDYVEQRFRHRFKGFKEFGDLRHARAVLTLTGQPSNGETVGVGGDTYTFNTSLGGAYSVLIGSTTADSLDNLIDAINASASKEGVTYGTGTAQNADASASDFYGNAIMVIARDAGTAPNEVALATDVTGADWSFSTLNGGSDYTISQPLSFPRAALYERGGTAVYGVPDRLKQAVAEYAVRAKATNLLPDPSVDDTGRAVIKKREKLGPIEEETQYEAGAVGSDLLRRYPAADQLIAEYLKPAGQVMRG